MAFCTHAENGTKRCRDCDRKWYRQVRRHRNVRYDLKKNHSMTVEEYEALFAAQGGVCAICGEVCRTGKRLAVDHSHVTGKVRGLLCFACNTGIGKLQDSTALLRRAADYVEERS